MLSLVNYAGYEDSNIAEKILKNLPKLDSGL